MEFECNRTKNTCITNLRDQDPLIALHFNLAVVYITIVLLLSVVGILGSSVMIYWVARDKRMKCHPKYFLINSTVADLCVSAMANPMCIAGAVLGVSHFRTNFWLCSIIASVCLTACICTFLNFTSLTLNRWVCICHNKQYDKIYNTTSSILICVFCWVGGFIAELPNFFGWGGHNFDRKSHQCIWDRTADRTYTLFVALGLLSCPFVVNGYCNVAILRKLSCVKRAVTGPQNEERNKLGQSIRSSKMLISLYVTFLVCWSPYIVMLVLDHGDTFSMEIHLFVTLLAHAHSSTTFFIYMAFNGRIREFVYRSLRPGRRQASVEPTQAVTGARGEQTHAITGARGVPTPGVTGGKMTVTIPYINTTHLRDNGIYSLKSSKLIFSVESNRQPSTKMFKPGAAAENIINSSVKRSNLFRRHTSFHDPTIVAPGRLGLPGPGLRTNEEP